MKSSQKFLLMCSPQPWMQYKPFSRLLTTVEQQQVTSDLNNISMDRQPLLGVCKGQLPYCQWLKHCGLFLSADFTRKLRERVQQSAYHAAIEKLICALK